VALGPVEADGVTCASPFPPGSMGRLARTALMPPIRMTPAMESATRLETRDGLFPM
jgi:hypothetical protein